MSERPLDARMQKLLILILPLFIHAAGQAFAEDSPFSSLTVDIGMVAADLEASAEFYTKVLGLTETKGFSASAEKATAFGLTNHQGADIRVFVLGEGEGATRLKLMSFPAAPGARPDQSYIHSTVGISYLTLRVNDLDAIVKNLKDAKVPLLGETPVQLAGSTHFVAVKDPDGNFIELIGPMKEE